MIAGANLRHGRRLAGGVHGFDDLEDGDWFETGSLTVTEQHIETFADLTGDRFEIHMDDSAAKALGFAGRVAHGLLVLALVDGLKNQAQSRFRAIASLGWTWRFDGPVFIGDEISATISIVGRRKTSKPDRGILTLDFLVGNQRGEIVQSGQNQLMVAR